MKELPVRLFTGARIHTFDDANPVADGLAVIGERLAAVGDVQDLVGAFPRARRTDLSGYTVVPALTDSHCHFVSFGLSLSRVDLRDTRSIVEAVERVRDAVEIAPAGSWVIGRGWDQSIWAEARWPTRDDLDPVSRNHPVALTRKDGHLLWVNSLALERGGVSAHTADPPGGEIVRDPLGRPTGLLKEEAKAPVLEAISRPDARARRAAVAEATSAAHRLGICGIHQMVGTDPHEALDAFSTYQELRREGLLGVRVWMSFPPDDLEHLAALGMRTGVGDDWLRVGGMKLFADGTLGSQTASMLEPFEEQPLNTGIPMYSRADLHSLIGRVVRAGLWPVVHAIGDRANRDVLDAFAAEAEAARSRDVRFRIEHAQLLHPEDIPRFAQFGVIASMQPIHATSDRDLADRFWGSRSRGAYAWRSLLRHSTVLAFGSDSPVETLDPWQGMYAAVTRRRPEEHREAWYPEEALTVADALRAYTVGAAFASGEEAFKGRLFPGALADFIVLDTDVLRAPAEALLDKRILATIIGGRPVFSSGSLAGMP